MTTTRLGTPAASPLWKTWQGYTGNVEGLAAALRAQFGTSEPDQVRDKVFWYLWRQIKAGGDPGTVRVGGVTTSGGDW